MDWFWAVSLPVVILIATPAMLLVWLVSRQCGSWAALVLKITAITFGLFILYPTGRWDIVGVWLRDVWIGVFVAALAVVLWRSRRLPLQPDPDRRGLATVCIHLTTVLALGFILWQLQGFASYSGRPVELDFPLDATRWYVGHGGSVPLVNYHGKEAPSQTYALDILGLNRFGFRAAGLLPGSLEDYAIYGEAVISPCDGTVLAMRNDLPDLPPLERDRVNLAGNFVLMSCEGATLLLAHLRPGTVAVRPGDRIGSGERVGEVGNSGNTSEPHLHIHAVRGSAGFDDMMDGRGIPVPMLFDGRFLIRNDRAG